MSLAEKWEKEQKPLSPIKNENLTCNTCRFKTNQTVGCEKYATKPVSVLKGGICYEYKKQKARVL